MKSLEIPTDILAKLIARNPYRVIWINEAAKKRWKALKAGTPERDTADSLLNALEGFPPPPDKFDIVDIDEGFATGSIKIVVATSTHIRVTITAKYGHVQKIVRVLDFTTEPRKEGKAKVKAKKKKAK